MLFQLTKKVNRKPNYFSSRINIHFYINIINCFITLTLQVFGRAVGTHAGHHCPLLRVGFAFNVKAGNSRNRWHVFFRATVALVFVYRSAKRFEDEYSLLVTFTILFYYYYYTLTTTLAYSLPVNGVLKVSQMI